MSGLELNFVHVGAPDAAVELVVQGALKLAEIHKSALDAANKHGELVPIKLVLSVDDLTIQPKGLSQGLDGGGGLRLLVALGGESLVVVLGGAAHNLAGASGGLVSGDTTHNTNVLSTVTLNNDGVTVGDAEGGEKLL